MNNLSNGNIPQSNLSNFFRKTPQTQPTAAPRKYKEKNREGSRPNFYIYNKHTQEVIELQKQASSTEVQKAFAYVSRFTDSKLLTLWAVIQVLETTQALRYRKARNSGEEFEITPDHPLKKALVKEGYNFNKFPRGGHPRTASLPTITIKVLGENL